MLKKIAINTLVYFIFLIFFISCAGGRKQQYSSWKPYVEKAPEIIDEAVILDKYLAETSDSADIGDFSSFISSDDALESLKGKTLVIDLRSAEVYSEGHIPGAVNVKMASLASFFTDKIKPFEYDKIILACYSGQSASYAASVLRHLGYGNVCWLRWGMSGWNQETDNKWSDNISTYYTDFPLEK